MMDALKATTRQAPRNPRTVLLVEDDPFGVQSLLPSLEDHGMRIFMAYSVSGAMAILALDEKRFDAIILDVRLPDGDGLRVCGWLRERRISMPVILVTNSNADAEILYEGLEAGACDCVRKPCSGNVLAARVRAALASFERRQNTFSDVGRWEFRPAERSLYDRQAGRKVILTVRECSLLSILDRNKGQTVRRQDLLEEVWGYRHDIRTHTVESHVYRLRRKMEEDPSRADLLVSCEGGYRLQASQMQASSF
jgi:DNA-binding response OmpR family regulator